MTDSTAAAEGSGPAGARRPRVVVAEDESIIRLDLAEMLGESGYEVVGQAADGQSAIDVVRATRPDVALLDVKMPVLDGISAAEAITGERLCPVVLLTAFSDRSLVARAAEAGAMGYLVKPAGRSDLVPALEVAMARWAQVQGLHAEVGMLQAQMAARKVIERAKGEVMQRLGLGEAEAFRWLRTRAMDRRMPLVDVAAIVLEGFGITGDGQPGRSADQQ